MAQTNLNVVRLMQLIRLKQPYNSLQSSLCVKPRYLWVVYSGQSTGAHVCVLFRLDYTRGMHRIAITVAAIAALLCGAGSAWAASGDEVDAGAIFEKYLSQAEKSDVDAQAILDMMYENGWYVAENKAEAI